MDPQAPSAQATAPTIEPAATTNGDESTAPLQIGDTCQVVWRDGTTELSAEVIERKSAPVVPGAASAGDEPSAKRSKTDVATTVDDAKAEGCSSDGGAAEMSAADFLYYVHYVEHDRRIDEWVPISRFKLSTLKRAPAEGTPLDPQTSGQHSAGKSGKRQTRSAADTRSKRDGRRRSSEMSHTDDLLAAAASSEVDTQSAPTRIGGGGNFHSDLAELEAEHHEITKVKNIEKIVMGKFEVEAWYYSPFPAPYAQAETLYICEYCLKYMKNPRFFVKHCALCPHRTPPGDEIYREGKLSVFELDGKDHRVYCQNLCLLAKLFLDHKTLYYDVDPFYFYVITEVDEEGAHIVGYFSKEKVSAEEYNLACILTFPQFQKCGYGKFIISLSYELSKREGKPGSPEKPLSDLGKISYRSYWTHVLLTMFSEQTGEENIQIKDISLMTGIKTEDIISTLQSLNMIRFWKGQHVVFVTQHVLDQYSKQK
eukprot:CCRYP_010234-RA/>CCRYP_010234-RA protein AED:0.00 eAED:0.00 QI:153/1/1/1/1/1/2/245/481